MLRSRGGSVALWTAVIGAAVVALVYAFLAASTRPFTVGADIATAVPLAAAVAVLAIRTRFPRSSGPAIHRDQRRRPPVGWTIGWVATAAVTSAGSSPVTQARPRGDHPTLSSLLDTFDSHRGGKTVVFVLWLALGSYLVRA